MKNHALFRYKTGTSFLHRLPAILKILALIPLAITIMHINIKLLPPLIVIIAVAAFLCGWTLKEFWFDIKPTVFYGFFLYEFSVITNVLNGLKQNTITISVLLPNQGYIVYFIKLILLLQVSTLFFRTSTSIAIKDALCGIERAIRLFIKRYIAKQISLKTRFADNFALTLNFIPEIFEQLSKIDLAYRARGGKKGIKKITVIVTALFSLSFYRASLKARAIAARET